MSLTRRELLTRSAAGVGILAVGDFATILGAGPAGASARAHGVDLGPLVPDPAGILDLPRDFSYRVVSRAGDALSGGGITPGRHDGTASFEGPHGGIRLVQNHE